MQPRASRRGVLLLAAVLLTTAQHAGGKLVDRPLVLPGVPPRPPGPPAASAAAAAGQRSGYFPIEGTQRRLFYWFFQVGL